MLVSNQVCVCVCEICTEARDRLEEPQEISVSFIFPLLPLTLLPLRDGILTLRPSFLPSSYSSLPPLLWLPSFMSPCLDCPYIQHCFGVLLLKPITLLSPTLAERCIWKVAWKHVSGVSRKREAKASVSLFLGRMLGESSTWRRSTLNCNYS